MDPYLLAVLSALLFGINPIVLQGGLKESRSEIAVLVGLLSGLPVLFLVAPFLGGFRFQEMTLEAAFYFSVGGLIAVFLGRTFLYLGIQRLGSLRASAFKNSAPLVTAILAVVFLGEVVGLARWAAIGLVIIGLTLVGRSGRQQTQAFTLSGLSIALATAVFYGIRPIFSKLGLNSAPLPLEGTSIGYLTALLLYLGYFLAKNELGSIRVGRKSLISFSAGGLLQVSGLLMLHYALQKADVALIYPISSSSPLFTFLLSYTVLGNVERLTIRDLLGTVLVVIGVILLLT